MKFVFLMFAFLFAASAGGSYGEAVKVKTTDYTCSQLNGLLQKHRSIWIQGFLGLYNNLAATRQEIQRCSGSYSSADDIRCNYWTPSLRTKDSSKCKIGVRCSCFVEDNDHGGRN